MLSPHLPVQREGLAWSKFFPNNVLNFDCYNLSTLVFLPHFLTFHALSICGSLG